jgi:hypothetical protein
LNALLFPFLKVVLCVVRASYVVQDLPAEGGRCAFR